MQKKKGGRDSDKFSLNAVVSSSLLNIIIICGSEKFAHNENLVNLLAWCI